MPRYRVPLVRTCINTQTIYVEIEAPSAEGAEALALATHNHEEEPYRDLWANASEEPQETGDPIVSGTAVEINQAAEAENWVIPMARCRWHLEQNGLMVEFENADREAALQFRRLDARFKGARLRNVLQCLPGQVEAGKVYIVGSGELAPDPKATEAAEAALRG